MALFSRRKKDQAPEVPSAQPEAAVAPAEPAEPMVAPSVDASAEKPPADHDAAAAASVGIQVSSFRGVGAVPVEAAPAQPAAPRVMPPREAPPAVETVPGLRDNVLLRDALAALSAEPTKTEQLNVARQFMQGHVFLRVQGDARTLLSEGKPVPLASTTIGERRLVLVYSSGAALHASFRLDGDIDTSAMGQPVLAVIKHVLAGGFDGILIDPASAPARVVLTKELLERALTAAKEPLTVKSLLAEPRTPEVPIRVAAALVDAPLWVAVAEAPAQEPGAKPRMGVAEARTSDGRRLLEIFSHPLEVVALGRNDRALPFTALQLARALRGQPELSGVIIDPGGPWIELSRDDLAPVLALEQPA